MLNVAINGFGRIGRLLFRAHLSHASAFRISAINDLMPIETAAHLLRYDSVHGVLEDVSVDGNHIIVNHTKIPFFNEPDPSKLPWNSLSINVVAECSGRVKKKEDALIHIAQGAERVLISAPCSDADKMVVFGVNHTQITEQDSVLSNASCTTNGLAPIVDVLHKAFGIKKGFLSTVHSYTADQRLVDAAHKDLRRARAASESIIPTSTGAARAIGKIFPDLQGRIDGVSVRVPTADVSFIDLTVNTQKVVALEDVNAALEHASAHTFSSIMRFCKEPLVSKDFTHTCESVIIDSLMTQVIDGDLVKVFGWYDNEWGFSHRMCDMLNYFRDLKSK